MEIELFENYLIYAQMMGIAKKVSKQFEDIYPEIIEQSNYIHFNNIAFVYMCSTKGINSARETQERVQAETRARARAESRTSSGVGSSDYSSGGEGFSSGGGGDGSFGGGGGRRRFPLKIKKHNKYNYIFTKEEV